MPNSALDYVIYARAVSSWCVPKPTTIFRGAACVLHTVISITFARNARRVFRGDDNRMLFCVERSHDRKTRVPFPSVV